MSRTLVTRERIVCLIGVPTSRVIVSASSSWRCISRSLARASTCARSSGDIRGHGPSSNASRAVRIARSMSWTPPSVTCATGSSVAGEITGTDCPSMLGVQRPPMRTALSWVDGHRLSPLGRSSRSSLR